MFRFALSVLAISLLAACAQTASFNPATQSPSLAPDIRQPAAAGPKFGIAIELPDGARSHGTSASVGSLKAVTKIKGRTFVDIAEAPTGCPASDVSGFQGCEVISDSSATLKSGTFKFYSKPKAKGCVLAIGMYKGAIGQSQIVPIPFKVTNKSTCWK